MLENLDGDVRLPSLRQGEHSSRGCPRAHPLQHGAQGTCAAGALVLVPTRTGRISCSDTVFSTWQILRLKTNKHFHGDVPGALPFERDEEVAMGNCYFHFLFKVGRWGTCRAIPVAAVRAVLGVHTPCTTHSASR